MEAGSGSRRRVLRQPQSTTYEHSGMPNTPQAGPSRLPGDDDNTTSNDDTDDQYPTPKLTSRLPLSISDDTPAARLRAVLKAGDTLSNKSTNPPIIPQTSSELDSDYDHPKFALSTPSIHKSSIKELFSRATREPGDTPQKGKNRWRRNSIDSSVDITSSRTEGIPSKGKRRSLSDDEADIANSAHLNTLHFYHN